jgi:hypothetical protein
MVAAAQMGRLGQKPEEFPHFSAFGVKMNNLAANRRKRTPAAATGESERAPLCTGKKHRNGTALSSAG